MDCQPKAGTSRDQKQSLISLAAIAAMFGTGHWLYAELGWGLAPAEGVLGIEVHAGIELLRQR